MNKEKIFVTGGTGCIGSWVVKNLIDRGLSTSVLTFGDSCHRLQLIMDDEDFENQREPHAIFLSGSLVSESKLRVYHDLLVPGGRLVTVCNEHEVENLAGLLDSLSGTCVEMRIDDHSMFVVSFKSNL